METFFILLAGLAVIAGLIVLPRGVMLFTAWSCTMLSEMRQERAYRAAAAERRAQQERKFVAELGRSPELPIGDPVLERQGMSRGPWKLH